MQTGTKIRKAIFPIAGLGTRFLPATKSVPKEMLPIVDKPLIHYAVAEAIEAGIDEFIFITGRNEGIVKDYFSSNPVFENALKNTPRDDASEMRTILDNLAQMQKKICCIRQDAPLGLGHAVWCARDKIGDEPFAVLLADDLILPEPTHPENAHPEHTGKGALAEMIEAWQKTDGGNMVATVNVARHETSSYGIITPEKIDDQLSKVIGLSEKPAPEDAQSTMAVVGRYIIEPGVFDELAQMQQGAGNEIQLTDSLASRIGVVPFHAFSVNGVRYDCGSKIGFLKANIAYALRRDDLGGDLRAWLDKKKF